MSRLYFSVLLISVEAAITTAQSKCTGKDGFLVCCAGFELDKKTGICRECGDGYFGENCSEVCRFPTFGRRCQGLCDCPLSMCDFVKGCTYTSGNSHNQKRTKGPTEKMILSTKWNSAPEVNRNSNNNFRDPMHLLLLIIACINIIYVLIKSAKYFRGKFKRLICLYTHQSKKEYGKELYVGVLETPLQNDNYDVIQNELVFEGTTHTKLKFQQATQNVVIETHSEAKGPPNIPKKGTNIKKKKIMT
ncbi:uncharacterized protein LOC134254176 [Saccostrea cucullata]|uniref:uncharacterized protein LOC134254176 n=1 Tax=Saccostrea cuccullata TaxID=36930 RepID=UPI002ED66AE4